ncbi:MAG TPA: hypothetical protein VMJ32_17285 [Pirellulales bacterium]|nr:hypothetical protein [Pirellulales bacterium]
MNDLLQEYCDSRGLALRVDRQAGLIRGIKILGTHSRNGRDYLPDALARAVGLYEGAKVNVNHPKGHPLAPRDYQERIGVIRNVQHRPGDGLFADFHFNPKHYLSEQLMWDAEQAPENVGFSHNVQAHTRRQGEITVVEEILQVHSVDLVADPATTRGLFEEYPTADLGCGNANPSENDCLQPASLAHDSQRIAKADLVLSSSALCEQQSGVLEKRCQEQATEISKLRLQIDQLQAKEAVEERRSAVRSLLAEYCLPDPDSMDTTTKAIVSGTFLQSLLSAPDKQTMRRLVEQHVRLLGSAHLWRHDPRVIHRQPLSRDQNTLDLRGVFDAKSFARAITA